LPLRLEERAPTRAFWRSHFEVWALSGLTQREYCERHRLSLKNLQLARAAEARGCGRPEGAMGAVPTAKTYD
jgi:hypothetical protein